VLSLTDTLGSLAVASKGHWMTGVSTDIGTSFVRPAGRVGDVLHATCILTGIGEDLIFFVECVAQREYRETISVHAFGVL
jgi:acyl-coenzyme A thioesterase 13